MRLMKTAACVRILAIFISLACTARESAAQKPVSGSDGQQKSTECLTSKPKIQPSEVSSPHEK